MDAHLYPFGVELVGSKDWYVSNIVIVFKWESRYTFVLSAAEITDYKIKIVKCFYKDRQIFYKNRQKP